MEEKKFDPLQFIGFILIAVILTWMLYRNGPVEEQNQNQKLLLNKALLSPSSPEESETFSSFYSTTKSRKFWRSWSII